MNWNYVVDDDNDNDDNNNNNNDDVSFTGLMCKNTSYSSPY
jgi:hypothetical protein